MRKNNLWRPSEDQPEKAKGKPPACPPNGHDRICKLWACKVMGNCPVPCAPLLWIGLDTQPREVRLPDGADGIGGPDYKDILADLNASAFPVGRLEEIASVEDFRKRALCALIAVKLPRTWIAKFARISERTLYRMLGGGVTGDEG